MPRRLCSLVRAEAGALTPAPALSLFPRPLPVRLPAPPVAFAALAAVFTAAAGTPARAEGQAQAVALPAAHTIGLTRDPTLATLLTDIRPAALRATDSTLVGFGTRHTLSDTTSSTRGIGAARRYLHAQLTVASRACNGCLRVEYDPAMVQVMRHPLRPTVNVVNVLAWLPGRDTSRVVVMGGHYDSCICSINPNDSTSDAPGADDDGSGSSAVVELARAFSRRYPRGLDATVIFALYAGEEQGLLGSTHLAERLHASGYTVVAAITDDIVGNVAAENGSGDARTVRAFTPDPDNGGSRELGRTTWALSEVYRPGLEVVPVFRLDRIGRGGDHAPFARRGDPAIRFTERLENYKRQHLPTDDLAHVDFDYVAGVARVNAAVVGSLALAPAMPESTTFRRDAASGGQAWRLSWKPVPGAASYEVVTRASYAPTWERVIPVGSATTYLLNEQLDDRWAGVRAVGADGHRSLVASIPAAPPVAAASR